MNEVFKPEHSGELQRNNIELNSNKMMFAIAGRRVESAVADLLKVFAIIQLISGRHLATKEDVELEATELLKELQVGIFDYESIFTMDVVNTLLRPGMVNEMSFEINQTPLTISSGSTVESVMKQFNHANEPTHEELNEWSKKEEDYSRLVAGEQQIVDKNVNELDALNFQDLGQLMDWLYEYNSHLHVGVNDHKQEILERFASFGLTTEKNEVAEHDIAVSLRDKKRLGQYYIGFMLQNLGLFRPGHIEEDIKDWKRMK